MNLASSTQKAQLFFAVGSASALVISICVLLSAAHYVVRSSCDFHLCSLHSAFANLTVNSQLHTLQPFTAKAKKGKEAKVMEKTKVFECVNDDNWVNEAAGDTVARWVYSRFVFFVFLLFSLWSGGSV
jgi:hypothetical protein